MRAPACADACDPREKKGPLVLVCATLYGDEVTGIDIIDRLMHLSIIKKLRGTLICIPVMNVYGLINQSRFLPDGRDLAESFPGSNSGSFAARLAYLFSGQIIDHVTHCINIRSGSQHTYKLPQVYYHPKDRDSEEMAYAFAAPIVIPSDEKTGFFSNTTSKPKVPTIIYEGGEALRNDEYTVKLGLRGIIKVFQKLQMLPTSLKGQDKKIVPQKAKETFWVRASLSGLFHFTTKMGRPVRKGDKLAKITDPFGSTGQYNVLAPEDGIIIGLNTHPHVYEGQGIIQIARKGTSSRLIDTPSINPNFVDSNDVE